MVTYIIIAIISYLLGSINISVILSKKIAGFDVREKGSGGTGATNVLRSVGKTAVAGYHQVDTAIYPTYRHRQ